jgi:hypothetical protein
MLLLGAGAVRGATSGPVAPGPKWHAFAPSVGVADVLVALDVSGRTAFAFSPAPSGAAQFSVRAWDLDRLTPRGPALAGPAGTLIKSGSPVAVDSNTHTVFVAAPPSTDGTQHVLAIGLRGGGAQLVGTMTSRFPLRYKIAGIAADSAHGRLFLLGAPDTNAVFAEPASGLMQVDAWKLGDAAQGRVTGDVAQPVSVPSQCGQPIAARFPAALLPTPDGTSVLFGCVGMRGFVSAVVSSPHEIAGVARLQVMSSATTHAFTLYPSFGAFGSGDSYTAPGANWIALGSSGAGQTNIKFFNIDVNRWVGNVAYDGTLYSVGSDASRHRAYLVVTGGFGSVELGAVPVTQLNLVPSLTPLMGPQQRVMAVDPKTHRVFIPASDDVVNGPDAYLLVVKDSRPRYDGSVDNDPDSGSLRAPEVAGKTTSARTVFVNAVGSELRLVGGTNGPCTNTVHIDWKGNCDPGTRNYQFAAARNVSVDNEHAVAEAVTTRFDDTTQGDTAKAQGVGDSPPAPPATCQDLGDQPAKATGDNTAVQCDTAKQSASSDSAASPPRMLLAARADDPAPAAVQVRHATSHATTERRADGTTVATATATAYGIDIFGVVQIGEVTATATTETHGQPGTAKATYVRTVQDVTINGQKQCQAACKLSDIAPQINDALAGRATIEFADPAKVRLASPGGVTARVAIDQYQHAEDQLVNDEPADSVITPAMTITTYADGTIAERQINRLALVSISQHYRIVNVDSDIPIPPGDFIPPPPTPPTGGTTFTPGHPVTITTPGSTTPPAVATGGDTPQGILGGIINGLRVVFRSPGQMLGIACVWMLLALPAYLAARRRLLLELPRLRRLQEDM